MIFYHSILASVAAVLIASPVFANNTAAPVAKTEISNVQTAQAVDIKINVNKATAKELLKVKGMNPAKARAIVTYRKKHGEFKAMDDLSKVKSLGKLKQEELKEILDQLSLS